LPIIPQFESRRDIDTGSPIARRSGDVDSVGGRAMQLLGETLSKVADKFVQAQTLEETTKADTKATIRLNEIQLEAAQDPDVWSIPKYQEKINKVKQEVGEGITIPAARDRFQLNFERDAIAADFNVRRTLRARQIDSMKATMFENIDTLEDSYTNAASPEEKKLIEFKRDEVIDNNIKLGVLDKAGAFKYKETLKGKWQESDIRNAIAIDPDQAKDMLLAGDFEGLTADETSKWTDVANEKIARNKNEAEDQKQQMWLTNDATLMENLENTSVQDITEMFNKGEISPQRANDTIKAKTDKSILPNQFETNKKIWLEMARDSVKPEQDLREFMNRLSKGVSEGNIQFNEASELSVQIKGLFKSAIKYKSKPRRFEKLIGAVMDKFKEWGLQADPAHGEQLPFEMTKELMKKVRDGQITEENIEEESLEIIKDTEKVLYPEYSPEDLEATAKETGMSVAQVYEILKKRDELNNAD